MHRLAVDITKPTTHYLSIWINALASGVYQHSAIHLHPSKGKFCAYGVLCDLFVRYGDFKWVESQDNQYYSSRYNIYRNSTLLPKTFRVLLGIDSTIDSIIVKCNDTTLNYMNTINYLQSLKDFRLLL